MVPLWLYLIYIFLGILAFFTFRLLLHLLIRLTSNQKERPLKFRVDEDYDYIKGWQTESENTNKDSDDGNKGGS